MLRTNVRCNKIPKMIHSTLKNFYSTNQRLPEESREFVISYGGLGIKIRDFRKRLEV
jgi:hypothetical protein